MEKLCFKRKQALSGREETAMVCATLHRPPLFFVNGHFIYRDIPERQYY